MVTRVYSRPACADKLKAVAIVPRLARIGKATQFSPESTLSACTSDRHSGTFAAKVRHSGLFSFPQAANGPAI